MNVNSYTIDEIDEDCYDLYVSDDDGYTWEFYNWYSSYALADDVARDLMDGSVKFDA